MEALAAYQKLDQARARAAQRYPYYSPVLYRLKLVLRPAIKSFSVDRHWRVYFNPDYVGEHTLRELGGILCQIVVQLLRQHGARRAGKNPMVWAIACLLESGSELVDDQMVGLVTEAVYPGFYEFSSGLSAEEYYHLLMKLDQIPLPWTPLDENGQGLELNMRLMFSPIIPGSDILGEEQPWEDESPGVADFRVDPLLFASIEGEVSREVRRQEDMTPGKIPDFLLRMARLRSHHLNWRRELEQQVGLAQYWGAGSVSYNWMVPNPIQQCLKNHFVLPSFELTSPRVLIIVDTSGSMQKTHLSLALGQIDSVLKSICTDGGILVMPTDSSAKSVQTIYDANQVQLIGGGGTDMGAGLAKAKTLNPLPDAVIVVTDGYTDWPEHRPQQMYVIVVNVSTQWSAEHVHSFPAPKWARLIEMFPKGSAGKKTG